jgi:large subunit ribosomal protein L19
MKNQLLALVEGAAIKRMEEIVAESIQKRAEEAAEKKAEKTGGVKKVEEAAFKYEVPKFEVGDQVDVHQRILEGQKERIQVFSGTVIARRGEGMREMFTVRRIVQGEGVERIFPLHSPRIAKVEVKRTGAVRRAKLYYLRDRVGKATRLRERKVKGEQAKSEQAKS